MTSPSPTINRRKQQRDMAMRFALIAHHNGKKAHPAAVWWCLFEWARLGGKVGEVAR